MSKKSEKVTIKPLKSGEFSKGVGNFDISKKKVIKKLSKYTFLSIRRCSHGRFSKNIRMGGGEDGRESNVKIKTSKKID